MFGPPIELIDCQSVYNLLNEGIEHSQLNDPFYLYLLGYILNQKWFFFFKIEFFLYKDCRPKLNYNESHIIIAKNIKTVNFSFQ